MNTEDIPKIEVDDDHEENLYVARGLIKFYKENFADKPKDINANAACTKEVERLTKEFHELSKM